MLTHLLQNLDDGSIQLPTEWVKLYLGPAEQQAVILSATGLPTKVVAAQMGKSLHTVRNQLANAMRKLGVSNRYELIAKLYREAPGQREPSDSLARPVNET